MHPTLDDDQLDELFRRVLEDRRLPDGVVFAGEFSDGRLLHVAVDNVARIPKTDAIFTNELCIRAFPERADGRKWTLVQPLFLAGI